MNWESGALLLFLLSATVFASGAEPDATNVPTTNAGAETEDQWILSLHKLKGDGEGDPHLAEPAAVESSIATETASAARTADAETGLAASYGQLEAVAVESASAYLRASAEFARFADSEVDSNRKQQCLRASRHAEQLADAMLSQRHWLRELRMLNEVEANAFLLRRLERFVGGEAPARESTGHPVSASGRPESVDTAAVPPKEQEPVDQYPRDAAVIPAPVGAEPPRSERRVYSSWTDIHDAVQSLKAK